MQSCSAENPPEMLLHLTFYQDEAGKMMRVISFLSELFI